jgi:phosphoglycerate dehydrogenase-like enzyme
VTNMRGIYSDHLADHAFAFVLALARDFPKLIRRQIKRVWEPHETVQMLHLGDLTLGIIGLGGIGYEVARRGRVCGMRVLAVDPRRRDKPDEVDELWPVDRLDELLSESDFVVICAPQTPQTEGMIGTAQLAKMKPTAYLINVGRGVIVQLDALVDALRERRIAGAALDVYEIEPLPADHPLWKFKNVILTPHVAGIDPYNAPRRFAVLRDNVRRFLAREPLNNVVDKTNWF